MENCSCFGLSIDDLSYIEHCIGFWWYTNTECVLDLNDYQPSANA